MMKRARVEIHGYVARGFEPVRETFAANFHHRGEVGASMAVRHRGDLVVDLWGGYSNRQQRRPWREDTLNTVFSVTKGVAAICFLHLHEKGRLDYDAPVASYWPEFAQAGKSKISVRTLLNHRAGLIAIDDPVTLDMIEYRWADVAEMLARQPTLWQPGTDQGYHGVTYGLYAQELFRRITGESIGTYLARELTGPLNADVHLGLAAEHEKRVATNYPADTFDKVFKIVPKLLLHSGTEGRVYRQVATGGDTAKAFRYPAETGAMGVHNFNTRRVHQLELPWGNGIASARGLARLYSALLKSKHTERIASAESIAALGPRQSWADMDRVLRKPMGWSQGFVKENSAVFSPNPEAFGHPGAGGALGWCDPVAEVAIGYVPNRMDHRIRSPRAIALCRSLYRCLSN